MNKKTLLAGAIGTLLAATLNVGVAGKYKFEAFKQDANGIEIEGSRRVAADWFDNLITNAGMDGLGTTYVTSLILACRVGTGSTPAAVTDTALVSQLAATTTINTVASGAASTAPYYGWLRRTFRFAAGIAAGNVSEVGIATTTTGGILFSRALIVDGGGTPITLTILSDELLDVVYEYRVYPPTADIAWGPLTISGTSYSGVIRASNVTSLGTDPAAWVPHGFSGGGSGQGLLIWRTSTYGAAHATQTLGAVTTIPAGTGYPMGASTGAGTTEFTASTYTPGNYYRDHTLRYDLNQGNVPGGIGSLYFSTYMGQWQLNFTPVVPKTASHRFTLSIRISWARHVF